MYNENSILSYECINVDNTTKSFILAVESYLDEWETEEFIDYLNESEGVEPSSIRKLINKLTGAFKKKDKRAVASASAEIESELGQFQTEIENADTPEKKKKLSKKTKIIIGALIVAAAAATVVGVKKGAFDGIIAKFKKADKALASGSDEEVKEVAKEVVKDAEAFTTKVENTSQTFDKSTDESSSDTTSEESSPATATRQKKKKGYSDEERQRRQDQKEYDETFSVARNAKPRYHLDKETESQLKEWQADIKGVSNNKISNNDTVKSLTKILNKIDDLIEDGNDNVNAYDSLNDKDWGSDAAKNKYKVVVRNQYVHGIKLLKQLRQSYSNKIATLSKSKNTNSSQENGDNTTITKSSTAKDIQKSETKVETSKAPASQPEEGSIFIPQKIFAQIKKLGAEYDTLVKTAEKTEKRSSIHGVITQFTNLQKAMEPYRKDTNYKSSEIQQVQRAVFNRYWKGVKDIPDQIKTLQGKLGK